MLQWIQKRLWPTTRPGMTPPHILVTIETSGPTLSKSDEKQAFAITLKATVDSKEAVTINTFQTILGSGMPALEHQGLTFKDMKSGDLAERAGLCCVLYKLSDFVTNETRSVVEVPPSSTAACHAAYTVTHTFDIPPARKFKLDNSPLSLNEQSQHEISQFAGLTEEERIQHQLSYIASLPAECINEEVQHQLSPVAGFTVGHRYEIGLGEKMSKVSWWRSGKKSSVFAGGKRLPRCPNRNLPAIQMLATNRPSFVVIE